MKRLSIGITIFFIILSAYAKAGVTLNLNNSSLKNALSLLFSSSSKSFSIPDIPGVVNVALNNVPFNTALNSILASTGEDLTYSVTNGVYQINLKNQDINVSITPVDNSPTPVVDLPKTYVKIKVNFADAGEIAMLMGGTPIISEYYSTAGMMGMSSMGGMGGGYGGGMNGGMMGGGMGGGMGGYGNNNYGGGFGNNSFGGGMNGGSMMGSTNNEYGNSNYGGGFGGGYNSNLGNSVAW